MRRFPQDFDARKRLRVRELGNEQQLKLIAEALDLDGIHSPQVERIGAAQTRAQFRNYLWGPLGLQVRTGQFPRFSQPSPEEWGFLEKVGESIRSRVEEDYLVMFRIPETYPEVTLNVSLLELRAVKTRGIEMFPLNGAFIEPARKNSWLEGHGLAIEAFEVFLLIQPRRNEGLLLPDYGWLFQRPSSEHYFEQTQEDMREWRSQLLPSSSQSSILLTFDIFRIVDPTSNEPADPYRATSFTDETWASDLAYFEPGACGRLKNVVRLWNSTDYLDIIREAANQSGRFLVKNPHEVNAAVSLAISNLVNSGKYNLSWRSWEAFEDLRVNWQTGLRTHVGDIDWLNLEFGGQTARFQFEFLQDWGLLRCFLRSFE